MSIQDEALLALRANRGPMSTAEVAKAIGRGEASVRDALTRAERAKEVTGDRSGRAVVWSLAKSTSKTQPTTKRKGARVATKRGSHIKPGHSAGVERKGTPGNRAACAERDEKVRKLVARHPQGLSRVEVAEKLDLDLALAYNSLSRLHRLGEMKTVRDGSRVPRWVAV